MVVTNTPDVLTEAVAEFTWALILAAARRLNEGERLLRRGAWQGWALDFMLGTEPPRQAARDRRRRTYRARRGRKGACVRHECRLRGKGTRDLFRGQKSGAVRLSMDELLVSSDVISLHVPGGHATRHMIDRSRWRA